MSDKEIVFRPLYQSPIVSVHDYCCQAVFFSRESTYRVSHPADCGDLWMAF